MNHTGQAIRIGNSESGAAMVEAAVILPFFLVIMLIMIQIALFCFHLLRFQYEVSEITRQAFVLTADQRATVAGESGVIDWEPFVVSMVNKRAQEIGISTNKPADSASIVFASEQGQCSTWTCAATAEPGDVFSISIPIREPIFGSTLAGISWANLSVSVKAIAFIQRDQAERSA
jgi:hypothetical protein